MLIECVVIAGILLSMSVIFFLKKRTSWALATLPLTIVPLADLLLAWLFVRVFNLQISIYWGVFGLVCAVAISCVWTGIAAGKLEHKSSRATYIGVANAFNIALAAILIGDIMSSVKEYGEVLH